MKNRIGAIEFMLGPGGIPLIGLTLSDYFHEMSPPDRVQFLIAASQVAFRYSQQIAEENPDFEEEIIDLIQNIELEPSNMRLDS